MRAMLRTITTAAMLALGALALGAAPAAAQGGALPTTTLPGRTVEGRIVQRGWNVAEALTSPAPPPPGTTLMGTVAQVDPHAGRIVLTDGTVIASPADRVEARRLLEALRPGDAIVIALR